jgi:hypothetical protein
LFFLLRSYPCIENGLLFKVEIVILDFEPFVDFDVEKGCGVEGYIDIDIHLVVEAGFQIEYTKLGWYFK